MYPKKRIMYATDAQDVCDGVNYAGRPSPCTYVPAGTGVVASHANKKSDLTAHENHDTYPTGAGRKNSPVNKPESALISPSLLAVTHKTSADAQTFIDRLPDEILCAIFLICGDPSPASAFPRDSGMHAYDVPAYKITAYSSSAARLGRVCVRWRIVSRGFPALWTTVDIAYPTKKATRILKLCLKYSAGLPLALWVSYCVRPNARKEGIDPRFMSLVAAHAHRWKEISMELFDELHILEPLVLLPPGALSSLRRARIDFYDLGAQESTMDTCLWRMLFTSPHLHCSDLTRAAHIRSMLAFAPLQQLYEIGLHCAEPSMIFTILSACTNLELLYIRIVPLGLDLDKRIPISIPSATHLPRLRTLMLCGAIDWAPLFASLKAPALDRLDLSHTGVPGSHIEQMLVRSSTHLRMLTIHEPRAGQTNNMLTLVSSSVLKSLRILRYEIWFEGYSLAGWEDEFDLHPYVSPKVLFTNDAAEAEQWYIRLCTGTLR